MPNVILILSHYLLVFTHELLPLSTSSYDTTLFLMDRYYPEKCTGMAGGRTGGRTEALTPGLRFMEIKLF